MATLALLTAETFFARFEDVEGKHELIRGEVFDMTGGINLHHIIKANLFRLLAGQIARASALVLMDAGVGVEEDTVLYPDVAVFDDPEDRALPVDERRFWRPSFVVEVLSPSTRRIDLNRKLPVYREIDSVRAILMVDPASETLLWHVRRSGGWEDDALPPPEEIDTAGLGFTLPRAEIFAR